MRFRQATVEKVLKTISEDNKDVRKGTWNAKEVGAFLYCLFYIMYWFCDEKEQLLETQLVEEGVTPQHSFEITLFSDFPSHVRYYAPY